MAVYLDCNATTPVEPLVAQEVMRYMVEEFGNAGSRTHEYGARAKQAVERARRQVASVVAAEPDEVVFTSGATESNNLALLGLAAHGVQTKRKHIVSTQIEHKAILEPLAHLSEQGFEVTLVPPNRGGWVEPEAVATSVRDDTFLVSVMHVNNETGIIQPLREIAALLAKREVYFHTDAAQGFGKELDGLSDPRIDLISISGHKIYGPKGVGALVLRKRRLQRPPLVPLCFGGGQERGLRPGTIPVALVVGLGLAAELALKDNSSRLATDAEFKAHLLRGIGHLSPVIHGDQSRALPTTLNCSFPGIDSEAAIVALKHLVALSNGSACTSNGHHPSHVLEAMLLPRACVAGALRWSWCHATTPPDYRGIVESIRSLR